MNHVIELGPGPRHRFYDAVLRWHEGPGEHRVVIDAATQALVDDLDSPALRVLAGLTPDLPHAEIETVLLEALDELGIPHPNDAQAAQRDHSSETYNRLPTDTIRFAIVPTGNDSLGGFELQVFVNEDEMTSQGAGMGMEPFDVLLPVNRLQAEETPRQVPIARCECGTYGCGSTDVLIRREGDVVHWDWLIEKPATSGATFVAEQYDAEVERLVADHSWERPEDTTTRLVVPHIDHDWLAAHNLRFSWAARDFHNRHLFQVSFMADDGAFQVFVRFPFAEVAPDLVSANVLRTLATPPRTWQATYMRTQRELDGIPSMAGGAWTLAQSWPHDQTGAGR